MVLSPPHPHISYVLYLKETVCLSDHYNSSFITVPLYFLTYTFLSSLFVERFEHVCMSMHVHVIFNQA